MKNFFIFFILLFLLLSSCNLGPQAEYGPDDTVKISGKCFDIDSTSYNDMEIGLWISSPESFLTDFFGLTPSTYTVTDSTGYYEFLRKGRDFTSTNGSTYKVSVMNYNTNLPFEPHTRIDFYPIHVDNQVPDLKLWNGECNFTINDDVVRFTYEGIEKIGVLDVDSYRFEVKAKIDGIGYNLWQKKVHKTDSIYLPVYIFGGTQYLGWRMVCEKKAPSDADFGFIYMSETDTTSIPLNGYTNISLGKNCFREATPETIKTLTDGGFGPYPSYSLSISSTDVSWIVLDLGQVYDSIFSVVVYGINHTGETGKYYLILDEDTSNGWDEKIDSVSMDQHYFYFENINKRARYIRLELSKMSNMSISNCREISVFKKN
ncbi:MAG: hypothetical protein WHT27_06980 [candidate division WOR-3 bacterium]|jgi:hypothetical protein